MRGEITRTRCIIRSGSFLVRLPLLRDELEEMKLFFHREESKLFPYSVVELPGVRALGPLVNPADLHVQCRYSMAECIVYWMPNESLAMLGHQFYLVLWGAMGKQPVNGRCLVWKYTLL